MKRPLGLMFEHQRLPVTVMQVEAHAAELGIQPGWILRYGAPSREPDPEARYILSDT